MKLFTFIILLFSLSSCSWQEYFVVKNNSNQSIEINYTLNHTDGFHLFDEQARVFKLTKSQKIDWEKQQTVQDLDSSSFKVKIVLKSHEVVVFGSLSNDHYENVNQRFINGRIFNLEEISIKKGEEMTTIPRSKFDSFFRKKDGLISFEVN